MVIKTAVKPGKAKLPSKRPFGSAYNIAKQGLKYFGYYKDIQQYDPGYYFEKYSYKPYKRVTGYAGQILHAKKRKLSSKRRYIYQKRTRFSSWRYWNSFKPDYYESRDFTKSYGNIGRQSRVYSQSNILYN